MPLPTGEQTCNTLRALAIDAVRKADSDHPGMPMAMAEIALAMWRRHPSHKPADPQWFDRRGAAYKYKAGVLPEGQPRMAIEASVTGFWWNFVRASGAVLGVDRFGESAPAADVYRHFGLTVDNLVATVQAVSSRESKS